MSKEQISVKSKLFKLRDWLSVAEAARHLSAIFDEEVNEADVLRLGLDGHLILSVNFVNKAQARLGEVVSEEGVLWTEYSPDSMLADFFREVSKICGKDHEEKKDEECRLMSSIFMDENRYLNLDNKITTIEGIWDLCMIGNEQLDLEHQYQMLTGGPEVTLTCLNGVFVERESDQVYVLQQSFDENEFQEGSTAQLEYLKEYIKNNNVEKEKAKELFDQHKQYRETYLKERREKDSFEDYYPAGGLPSDSVIVVRTQALINLQKSLASEELKDTSLETQAEISCLDTDHSFYAKELKIAVEAWMELYEKNPPQHIPQGGHKKYITKWLEGNYPNLSQRARDRITTIINPNPKGGASPT